MSQAHRFARQLILAEVGPEGQARISAMVVDVPSGRSGRVAADYLTRAGAQVVDGAVLIPVSAHGEHDATRIALDTLSGALSALEAFRRTLGMAPHAPLGLQVTPDDSRDAG